MFSELIEKLREFNRKSNARSRHRIERMKESFKSNSDLTNSTINESESAITESDSFGETIKPRYQTTLANAIDRSTQRSKERTAKMKAEQPAKLEAIRARSSKVKQEMDKVDPKRKKILNMVFMVTSCLIAFILNDYDIWPASFFKRLDFLENLYRREMWIGIGTAMIIYLFLFPIQYFFLRLMANRVQLNENKEYDKSEKVGYNKSERVDRNEVI